MRQQLPNSVAVLVLGILSIITGCWTLGLILGIIAVTMSGRPMRLYRENPELWDGYGMLNAGRICGIIGIILGSLAIFYWILVAGIFGAAIMGGAMNEGLNYL